MYNNPNVKCLVINSNTIALYELTYSKHQKCSTSNKQAF